MTELDKRGIDLHSTLCLCCDDQIETVDQSLLLCKEVMVMVMWDKVLKWWNKATVNQLSIRELFEYLVNGCVTKLKKKEMQEAVMWITTYFIWRNRNNKIFGAKVLNSAWLLQKVQISCYNWMKGRLKKGSVQWFKWITNPFAACLILISY